MANEYQIIVTERTTRRDPNDRSKLLTKLSPQTTTSGNYNLDQALRHLLQWKNALGQYDVKIKNNTSGETYSADSFLR